MNRRANRHERSGLGAAAAAGTHRRGGPSRADGVGRSSGRLASARGVLLLGTAVLLAVSSGCAGFPWLRPARDQAAPRAFVGAPTIQDVIYAVNTNSDRVRQLQTRSATLWVPNAPALSADLAMERPGRFRMRAELMGITGPEMDLGTNEELVWMWVKRAQPPALYFARRDQLAASAAHAVLPIEPEWLSEAIGAVWLDPGGVHEGPYPRGLGQLEVRSRVRTAAGEFTKITVIDAAYAWVLEQHWYDSSGRLAASARTSRHRFYPEAGVSLPHFIEVEIAPRQGFASLSFQLHVGAYLINQLNADPARLWAMPQLEGYPVIDLGDPRFTPLAQEGSRAGARLSSLPEARPYRPRYRGYTISR